MTSWVPSTEDIASTVTAFSADIDNKVEILLYSNFAAYNSDIAELDGLVNVGTKTDAELTAQTDYTDGYAIKVYWTFPKAETVEQDKALCIINVATGGTCFRM